MLEIGQKLPAFIGVNQNGDKIKFSDFESKKLIVFFYPKANTPGCTAEACDLSNHYDKLKELGYHLLGISPDSVKSQKKFQEKYNFPFDLIADETHEISELFGVWQLKKFMGREFMGVLRTTFIFDERGICVKMLDKVKTKEAAKQILEILE